MSVELGLGVLAELMAEKAEGVVARRQARSPSAGGGSGLSARGREPRTARLTAAGVREAERKFRRIVGYSHLATLIEAARAQQRFTGADVRR